MDDRGEHHPRSATAGTAYFRGATSLADVSSRSRRAASGSRKGPTPRRTTPEVLALREARHLVAPGTDRLTAETWASIHLGSGWADAAPDDPRTEVQLVMELVAEARRRPSSAAAAALAAARLVVPHPEIDSALADLEQPVPRWASQPAPEPLRVWRAGDPWRSQETWFVDYGDHLLVESVSHPGGTVVRELSVADRGVLRRYDAMLKGEETLGSRVEVPLEEALSDMRAALRETELAWPREPSESYAEHRLLALARLGTASGDRGVPDEDRELLRADLLNAEPSPAQRRVAGMILDYAYRHLHHPLRWSPEEALLFLLDWVPRQAAPGDAERRALPALLERWVVLALTRAGIEARWHQPVVEAVRHGAPVFAQLYDESSAGPARQLASALDTSGVDRDDDEAVQSVINEWHAARLARTALLTHDVPAGVALCLTVTLLDVSPPIWRRLVVPADVTLDRLSGLLQAAMGWHGGHLHEWVAAGTTYGEPRPGVSDERTAQLAGVLTGTDRLAYLYDLGDSWRHEVVVDDVLLPDEAGQVPRLDAGARACPPEDIGGWPGYKQLLAGELVEGHEQFDPERFDLAVFDTSVRQF